MTNHALETTVPARADRNCSKHESPRSSFHNPVGETRIEMVLRGSVVVSMLIAFTLLSLTGE